MTEVSENITLNVEGMTCSNCALGISKRLEKKGLENVSVNFSTGEASFTLKEKDSLPEIIKEIDSLGYKVIENKQNPEKKTLSTIEKKFYFTLIFTIPLFLHMLLPIELLQDPIVQLLLCLPVLYIGIIHFGKSAWGSLKSGVPNMDVLVIIGSVSAFIYSIIGTIQFYGTHEIHNYLFYETTATIISLVLLGNLLEHRSVKQTTTAIKELSEMQVTIAKKLSLHDNHEHIEEIEFDDIKVSDILIVNSGDKIPVDGEIISGNGIAIDESMITGESLPSEKNIADKVIGGTVLVNGNFRMKAEQVGKNTTLSKIIELVKHAQQSKPEIQKLGDQVSAIFVPIVLVISLLTFIVSHFVFDITLQQSLMRSIAVLVISCPCAMGLATPTAVMAGIGRAAKKGILIKGGSTLEEFTKIKNIVFDKTGTLTTGTFKIKKIELFGVADEKEVCDILFNLEQHSSHPIAKSIVAELKHKSSFKNFIEIKEEKGLGIMAKDDLKNVYKIGSYKVARALTLEDNHEVYVLKNDKIIAFVDLEDTIVNHAQETITALKAQDIKTFLLSGDSRKKCFDLGSKLGVDKVYSEQSPAEKLEVINELLQHNKIAMVGDGINDAPALAKASIGISFSNATQVAIQSAQIILLKGNDLSQVNEALLISKHTLLTIKQNLFWAFFYNIIAIPLAAMGFLSPMIGALAMAFSDVIVIGNSIRLKTKKLK